MKAMQLSAELLNVAPLLYFVAMTLGVFYWVRKGRVLYWAIPLVAGLAFSCQTTALGLRWVEGGLYRPPWTNLYESLIYFSWGLALVAFVAELRFKVRSIGVFAYALVFAGLGMAFLTPGKAINPLVPALQSWWILAHSFLAAFAYSGLVVGSVFSFLYLIKMGIGPRSLGLWTAVLGIIGVGLAGGTDWLLHAQYHLNEMVFLEGRWVRNVIPGSNPVEYYQVLLPNIGQAFWVAAVLYLGALGAYFTMRHGKSVWPRHLLGAAIVVHVGTVVWIFVQSMTRVSLTLGSNPYHLAFMAVFTAIQLFLLFVVYFPGTLAGRLPDAAKLDRMAWSLVMFGFPFMTLILITGAIWAHEAWGRFWGWDPKETTALVTWLIYAAYIHARRLPGWSGRKAAMIAVVGFYSVIFTYLGANLVLSGLHSYGAQ